MGSLLVFEFVFEKLVLYFALKENYLAVIRYANLVQVAYFSSSIDACRYTSNHMQLGKSQFHQYRNQKSGLRFGDIVIFSPLEINTEGM